MFQFNRIRHSFPLAAAEAGGPAFAPAHGLSEGRWIPAFACKNTYLTDIAHISMDGSFGA
jgi:hypothetical protein